MPVFRAIKQWRTGQPAASPGLLFNLLMMVRLEHLQGDALHQLLQDELIRGDVQCSQLVAHAALQIAGTATDHFPCRPVRSFAQVQIQVSQLRLSGYARCCSSIEALGSPWRLVAPSL